MIEIKLPIKVVRAKQRSRSAIHAKKLLGVGLLVSTFMFGCTSYVGTTIGHYAETIGTDQYSQLKLSPAGNSGKLKDLEIPKGYKATLYAEPPQINYPTFVKATADGRVFVAIDKNGSVDREENRGSVVLTVDDNKDGKADRFTQFVPNVDSPRGIEWDGQWLYVLHPPHLTAYRDNDGDGVSDESRSVVNNIAFDLEDRPADHTSNGVTLGIDGWLYLAIGDFGFMKATGTDGRELQLRGGGVVRVRPDGTGLELYSKGTRNIYEVAVDPRLNAFSRDNTNDGGGWDVRLHQHSGMEEHGYPSLYLNFADETIAPISDYGGGSGTGAHYLYEPGFPGNDGDRLYTVDWGRSAIFQHELYRDGATIKETVQKTFINLDRVTDLDVDASSHLYASSWSGGRFVYRGENIGYVVRIEPEGYRAPEFPTLSLLTLDELASLMKRQSAVTQLAVQQEILRRKPAALPQVEQLLLDQGQSEATRIAALYTIKLALGVASSALLESLTSDKEMGALAVRALADDEKFTSSVNDSVFKAALKSHNARTRLEAIIAIARTQRKALAGELVALSNDNDPRIAHTAVRALAALQASAVAVDALIDPDIDNKGPMHALYNMHTEETVSALIEQLNKNKSPMLRANILKILTRLAQVDGDWSGDSWGTRPDTTGPYYQLGQWSQTPRILNTLYRELDNADTDLVALLQSMMENRVDLATALPKITRLVQSDRKVEPVYLSTILRLEKTPEQAVPTIKAIALAEDRNVEVRLLAARALARMEHRVALDVGANVLARLEKTKLSRKNARSLKVATKYFLENTTNEKRYKDLLQLTYSKDNELAKYAWAGLLTSMERYQLSELARKEINTAIEQVGNMPERQMAMIRAISQYWLYSAEQTLFSANKSQHPGVKDIALKTAKQFKLNLDLSATKGQKIADLSNELVIKRVSGVKGDSQLGKVLFTRQGCAACHTVDPTAQLKGPFLGNITSIYRRKDLALAILQPNDSIAQGFATNSFEIKEGASYIGFVTQESAEMVQLRDITGKATTIKVTDIKNREHLKTSMMPSGLVSALTIPEFASLIAYMESLSAH
jgi:putative membrane-bound dehydrogenase-like protein